MPAEQSPAQKICDYLNSAFNLDPGAIRGILFDRRIQCGESLANHPLVQVSSSNEAEVFWLNAMGLLTGAMLSVGDDVIVGEFDDVSNMLKRFSVVHKSKVGL